LKYDTAHGRFAAKVDHTDDSIIVNGDVIAVSSERNPAQLPWQALNVDVVFECTGMFQSKDKASAHIEAGAKKVIISAPAKGVDATIVYGVNDNDITSDMTVISNASCTTNCLAPFAKVLNDELGIESGLMNTIHAYTNDQRLSDVYHTDVRRARAAAMSMIPTKTGAAAAVGLVVPELAGKVDGLAVRVPTINVSLVDLTFIAKRDTTPEEVNEIISKAVAKGGSLAEVLAVNEEPLVSVDFNHNPYSSNFDATETRVSGGRLVKVMSWYDNEWGFSNRMLDNAVLLMK
jgi:glyceraldehyde 3-phosphate dehydrogenase